MPKIFENEIKPPFPLPLIPDENRVLMHPKVIGQYVGGSSQEYGNPRLKEVHVAPGQSIQDAIDGLSSGGGGIVRLLSGTHYISEDILISSRNIYLVGEGIDRTIIDAQGNAAEITFYSNRRTIGGTITFSEGSTTATGVGTTFTNASAGDFIYVTVGDRNFLTEILSIESNTSLTLKNAWPLTGVSATFAPSQVSIFSHVDNVGIRDLTIQNCGTDTSDAGIYAFEVSNFTAENVKSWRHTGVACWSIERVFDSKVINCEGSYNASGDASSGFVFITCRNVLISNCLTIGTGSSGFEVTPTSFGISFSSCHAYGNAAYGFDVESGDSTWLYGCLARQNDTGGYLFDSSDQCVISSCHSDYNGEDDGVGIDTANSSADLSIVDCFIRNEITGIDTTGGIDVRIVRGVFSSTTTSIKDAGTNTFYENIGFGTFTASNGANNNINLGEDRIIRISGPTAAFNITGITNTCNAKAHILYNTTSQDMTITNQATSDDTQQILTSTGADVTITGQGVAGLYYDATSKKWILLGTQG